MKRDIFILARGVVLMAAGMLLLMSLLLLIDLRHAGLPLGQVSQFNVTEARHLSNSLNRNFNQLTAVVFTTVAIAVPLTANMYSVKFLELFIQDPVNAAVLTFVVFANLNNTWWAYGLKDNFVPVFQIYVSVILLIVCFALLFPYLYYVFRFLHPNTLLLRLEKEISANLRAAGQRPARSRFYRQQVAEGVEHIANIAIRSIDRADRNTAIESVLTLERVARAYWSVKPRLAPNWFGAESESFLGFSAEAIEEIRASHSWVEMKLFSQLRQVMSAALTRMHDLVSTGAESLRKVGLEDAARCDVALREMVMEYFNTFIRLALTRRDVRSVFVLFDQYRSFAEALNAESPDLVEEIAYYFEYYGQVARELQLNFVVESVAHDLGRLVQHAWKTEAPNRQALLEHFLHYDLQAKSALPGVKKAQAILASYFLLNDYPEAAAAVRTSFISLEPLFIRKLKDDLLHVKREKYWEITERRLNIEYVPDAQREKLREFLDSIHSPEIAPA